MPEARKVLNAFTAAEVRTHSGLSRFMIDYLARDGYLEPTYGLGRVRGRVRYYSYRDLVIARILKRLTERGVELKRLKRQIKILGEDKVWLPKDKHPFDLLATDGKTLFYAHQNGTFVELSPRRQHAFAFVVNVKKTEQEIKRKMSATKLERFSLENRDLLFADSDQLAPPSWQSHSHRAPQRRSNRK